MVLHAHRIEQISVRCCCLAGLFVLIYVLVMPARCSRKWYRQRPIDRRLPDGGIARPGRGVLCDGSSSLWIVIAYFFHQSIVDA
jgi:hypothetical protein